MISNEERRRVAKKLLEIIWCMRKREEFYKSDVDPTRCGNVTYRNIAGSVEESGNLIKGNYINIVERLADLIDRPTRISNKGSGEGGRRMTEEKRFNNVLCPHCYKAQAVKVWFPDGYRWDGNATTDPNDNDCMCNMYVCPSCGRVSLLDAPKEKSNGKKVVE